MTSPAAPGVDFDRNRIGQGELIAGIAGFVLLISLWFKWYGVSVGGSGLLKGFSFGASADAWQAFSLIDILLFLIALIAIGVAVLRGVNRMPVMPYPPSMLVTAAGGLAVLLILFRILDKPVDTHGVPGINVSLKFGIFVGLISAAGVAYGGWRAMQETGASFSSLGGGGGGSAAPTTPMPPAPPGGGAAPPPPAQGGPGVPGGGAAGVSPGKEGPGAPHPGTSTGGPGGDETTPPAASASDPVPGSTGSQTPPGIAGEPPPGEGTHPPGL